MTRDDRASPDSDLGRDPGTTWVDGRFYEACDQEGRPDPRQARVPTNSPTASRTSESSIASCGAELALVCGPMTVEPSGPRSSGTSEEEPNPLAEWISEPG